MEITERTIGDLTILDLRGRLVAGDGDEVLRDAVDRIVRLGRTKVLLNMDDVHYIDSGGVGMLASKYTSLRRRNGQLKLCNLHPRTTRVLDITRLLTVFESFGSEAEGVASFGETGEPKG
jgi:anti-sigma B factor antagonist